MLGSSCCTSYTFPLGALTTPAALRRLQVPKFYSVKRSKWYFLQQHMLCVSTLFQLHKLDYFMSFYLFENFPQTAGKVPQTHCKVEQPQSSSACSRERVCLWHFAASMDSVWQQ